MEVCDCRQRLVEVLAGSGFDIILIDTEHTSITLENLHHCLAAMKAWEHAIELEPDHKAAQMYLRMARAAPST